MGTASAPTPWTPSAGAVHEGLISGMENNTLAPQGTATRAQVAQILMNFHQKLDK